METAVLTRQNLQEVLKALHGFLGTEMFQVHGGVNEPSLPLRLRTRAPDGTEREAIFAAIEGIVMRSTCVGKWENVIMINILLPWQTMIQRTEKRLVIDVPSLPGGQPARMEFLISALDHARTEGADGSR